MGKEQVGNLSHWLRFNPSVPFFIFSCFFMEFAFAEMYRCIDDSGNTAYKSSACSVSEKEVKKIKYDDTLLSSNIDIQLNDSLKVLYQGSNFGTETRFVKIAIYEESESHLTLEVTGYFSGRPKGKLQFRVVPNIPWSYSGDVSTTKRGFVTAYTRIALKSSAKDIEKSDILSLQLWHYYTQKNKNKANRLKILTVPFKKQWVK